VAYRPLPPPPPTAVTDGEYELGRFNAPFPRANLLEVARPFGYRLPLFLKRFRLKEWQALQFGDGRWYFFTALYDARLFSAALFHAWDREKKRHFSFEHIFPGSRYSFGESLDASRVACTGRRRSLSFDIAWSEGRIDLAVARASRGAQAPFGGGFRFSCGPKIAAPSVVCLPLGLNRAMYSTKVLMPMEGEFEAEGERFRLEGPSAMGVLDDHKGYYPWRMRYDWVSGFGLDAKGRRVGFNLTDNQVKDQERYNENCVWIGNKVWVLPPVRVTRATGPTGDWVIQDTEGLVDLVFSPEVPHDLRFRLGLVESDYHGPFGSFKGFIKNGEGEKIEAERLFGAGEQKYLRA
jgi:hypothetical protein